jgi:putative heme-binding domain-containing protein
MKLLAAAPTQEEQLHYVLVLRVVHVGWSAEQRKAYFGWINYAEKNYKGGASFRRFLQRIREDAIKTLSPQEKETLADLLKGNAGDAANASPLMNLQTKPRQFVRNWQMQDLLPVIEQATHGRNFERGRAAFVDTGCVKCHRFGQEGGATGPDLTGVGNRFQPADVLESILLPSKVISDQYQATEVRTTDGDVLLGQVESEDADTVRIRTNPYALDAVPVKKSEIKDRRASKVSLMPEGLVDVLTKDEVLDLIAYLRSGGNPKDKAFGQ